MRQSLNLLISLLHLLFVVCVLLLVRNNLLQALIPHPLIVVDHLLQLVVQVLSLLVPALLLPIQSLLQLLLLCLLNSFIRLKLILL